MSQRIARLLDIMAALRTPDSGCPWDLEQTSASIAPYAIEEAHEVVDAIERNDLQDLRDELGDLLFQVVFHARMAQEKGAFTFDDVVDGICDKMIRRHPHVFADERAETSGGVATQWSEIKAREKAERAERHRQAGGGPQTPGVLDGVPLALPAMTRAVKLQQKAGAVGFDWANARLVLDKIREETEEIAAELPQQPKERPSAAVGEEIGDLLFVVANLARHVDVDPEQALRGANAKFERRFHHIEMRLAERGVTFAQSSLDEMERFWVEAKMLERITKP
jgi:MazG family protein